jgi:flavin reductase (DIM6/NTAB) family NADH-FMN oxidoreductase RutF
LPRVAFGCQERRFAGQNILAKAIEGVSVVRDIGFSDEADKALAALREGAFLTAGDSAARNVMTIAWGSIGFMWGKPVFTVLVRPSRYTHKFMEGGEFTVSLPLGGMRDALALCGSKSGRDVDKVKAAGLTLQAARKVATPVVAGCGLYYECRVVYKYELTPARLDRGLDAACYKDGDYHTVYVGEIVAAYAE